MERTLSEPAVIVPAWEDGECRDLLRLRELQSEVFVFRRFTHVAVASSVILVVHSLAL